MPQYSPSIQTRTERVERAVLVTSCSEMLLPQTPGVEEARKQLDQVQEAVATVTNARVLHWLRIIGEATDMSGMAKDPALDISRLNMAEEYKRALKIPKTEQVELFVGTPDETGVQFGLRTREIPALAVWRLRFDESRPEEFKIFLESINTCRSDLFTRSTTK